MKRILFVDDEPNVLDGLRRMLYPLRDQWRMVFAGSGREALRRLEEAPFDILVTDARMPQMGGAELLEEVRQRFPQTIRIVLSGTTELDLTLRTATLAHQYLCKPCDAATLRATLERTCSVRQMLEDTALKQLISGINKLPSLPAIYLKLNEALGSDDACAKDVAEIIAQDMAMTAKVLQMVNSALFGARREITCIAQAVTFPGMETVKSLAVGVMAFSQFHDPQVAHFATQLTEHSLRVGILAREMAASSQFAGVTADGCFVAGLLHDIGKLILADNRPAEFQDALQIAERNGLTAAAAEARVFGATHADVGAYLLWLWGLPDCVTEAVALHHKPEGFRGAVMAVHVADALAHNHASPELDAKALGDAGLMEQLPRWRRLQNELAVPRWQR
ncbi:MAG: response regulator [Bryobacteraceae bacterium]|jgi:putative nucleotidyltransferase with HDIG domain